MNLFSEVVLLLGTPVDELAFMLCETMTSVAVAIRRKVLSIVAVNEQTNRDDIAEDIATDTAVPVTGQQKIAISLHHNHLPRLADEQYIDYDPRTGDVVRWENRSRIKTVLNSAGNQADWEFGDG